MRQLISRFLSDRSGATAIEYSLIATGISMAIIATVNRVGTAINADFGALYALMK